ncbi:MAG: hypothetical protein BWY85_02211 [Firmicutes bacterium ADurb.Bin506]|jgi:hypothetical protein|nr:MAG: hypothetical protein BWY85_02211 [Firmicutes bacterium ADurb.Bin506]
MKRLDIYDGVSVVAVVAAVLMGAAVIATQLRLPEGLVSRLEGTPIWGWTAEVQARAEAQAQEQARALEPQAKPEPNPDPVGAADDAEPSDALGGSEAVGAFGGVAVIKLRAESVTVEGALPGIAVETYPQLEVLVNGSAVADFKYGAVWVVAGRGDLVELRLPPESGSVQIRVETVLGDVSSPPAGLSITAVPGITELGNIMM